MTMPKIDEIIRAVESETGVDIDEMRSRSRERHIANARSIVLYLHTEMCGVGRTAAGRQFGLDHSSVTAAVTRVKAAITTGGTVGASAASAMALAQEMADSRVAELKKKIAESASK